MKGSEQKVGALLAVCSGVILASAGFGFLRENASQAEKIAVFWTIAILTVVIWGVAWVISRPPNSSLGIAEYIRQLRQEKPEDTERHPNRTRTLKFSEMSWGRFLLYWLLVLGGACVLLGCTLALIGFIIDPPLTLDSTKKLILGVLMVMGLVVGGFFLALAHLVRSRIIDYWEDQFERHMREIDSLDI